MKRNRMLLVIVISVSMIANLTACKKTEEGSDPSATEPSDLLTQAPTETTPSDAEPNEDYKNDIAYYPFPLLNMTVGEIEQKYGKVIYEHTSPGWVVCSMQHYYDDLYLYFDIDIEKLNNSNYQDLITSELIPSYLRVWGKVYPGLQVGAKCSEIDFEKIPNHKFEVSHDQDVVTFNIYEKIQVEDYTMYVNIGKHLPWNIVEKYLGYNITEQEAFEKVINGGEVIQPEDILNWLQDGHMEEIADIEISSIEIRRQD